MVKPQAIIEEAKARGSHNLDLARKGLKVYPSKCNELTSLIKINLACNDWKV
jgi:hypothetical protein